MFLAARLGFSAAPLVLGLILGQLTETNFLQGRMLAGDEGAMAYFTSGSINKIIITMCILSIIYSIYSEIKLTLKNKRARMEASL